MSKPPEATRHNNSTKLLILLPIQKARFNMRHPVDELILGFYSCGLIRSVKLVGPLTNKKNPESANVQSALDFVLKLLEITKNRYDNAYSVNRKT